MGRQRPKGATALRSRRANCPTVRYLPASCARLLGSTDRNRCTGDLAEAMPNGNRGSDPGGRPSREESVGALSRTLRSSSDRFGGCSGHRTSKVASDRFRFVPSFDARPQSAAHNLEPVQGGSAPARNWSDRQVPQQNSLAPVAWSSARRSAWTLGAAGTPSMP